MNSIFKLENIKDDFAEGDEINSISFGCIKTNKLVDRAFDILVSNDIIDDLEYTEYTLKYESDMADTIAESRFAVFDDVAYISWIWITEAIRGDGYGNKLLEQTLNYIKKHNIHKIYTIPKSDAAKSLFSNYGFKQGSELYCKEI